MTRLIGKILDYEVFLGPEILTVGCQRFTRSEAQQLIRRLTSTPALVSCAGLTAAPLPALGVA